MPHAVEPQLRRDIRQRAAEGFLDIGRIEAERPVQNRIVFGARFHRRAVPQSERHLGDRRTGPGERLAAVGADAGYGVPSRVENGFGVQVVQVLCL